MATQYMWIVRGLKWMLAPHNSAIRYGCEILRESGTIQEKLQFSLTEVIQK